MNPVRDAFPWLLGDMPEAEAEELASLLRAVEVQAGTTLLTQGEASDRLYLVPGGQLSVTLEDGERVLHLADKGGGAVVGELGALRPGPASATVKADTAMTVHELTHENLTRALEDASPIAASRLLLSLAQDIAMRVRECSAVDVESTDGEARIKSAYEALHGVRRGQPVVNWIPRDFSSATDASPEQTILGAEDLILGVEELKPLGEANLRRISRFIEIRRCNSGDRIVREGDRADGMYLVLDGEVEARATRDAEFQVRNRMGKGEVFGQIAFLLRTARTAEVTATRDCTLGILYPAMVISWLQDGEAGAKAGAHFLHWVASQLAEDARNLNDLLRQAATA